ncbi:Ig-like domain-containing protein [Novosphingobium sp. 9U]|uniref:Ig-like domain-containing protein n=1 Tax=Novosphingobium sp. 9U TaxID=2653158 RepID=UPI0012F14AB1|nr:Ig-like domain-containing protein [Novosphingobium sp. 9U]VWX49291.1 VCBS repeat-containing protein [Novosphingobium sp. 9U]
MTISTKMVNNEVFLQGKYLSVGVNSSGDIGSRYSAPAGYATDLTYSRVGLLGDTDGFGVGNAALRDAIVRGAPIEGFNIGYKSGTSTYVHSNQEMAGLVEIAGAASNSSTSSVGQANWNGTTSEKLGVDQKITLTEDAKYIRFQVTLTNNSASTMADLRYMRTADPDLGEGYATVNTVVKQGDDGALITAAAAGSSKSMFLYSRDTRAVVTSYGFINESPYSAAVSTPQAVGTTTKTDTSINLNFRLGTLAAGGSTTVVFYMGVTDNLATTVANINGATTTPLTTNTAPDAINDQLAIVSGETGVGNLLANDKDANGDALTAALKLAPAHGSVTVNLNGSYTYKATAGYVGTDSFTYTASDGKALDTAIVTVTITAPPVTPDSPTSGLPNSPLVQRPNTVNGSASTSSTLTGVAQHNSFYFDLDANSGSDKITNFGVSDILVTDGKLYDGNGDGFIALSSSTLALDGVGSADQVVIAGVTSLRFLGNDQTGLSVYADGAVLPVAALEGKLSNDILNGDAGDLKKDVFFFDTGLDVRLGDDQINNFGLKDVLVTTSALSTTALGTAGMVRLVGGSGDPTDTRTAGEVGTIDVDGTTGTAVQYLEYDGAVIHDDVTFYIYSLPGSAAGIASLSF